MLDTEITLSGGPSICEGDSVSLSVDPDATTIEWYLDGQLLETQAPQIETQTGGAYYAILSHPSCHIQTEPVEIEVIPYPGAGISLSGDPLICEGESLTLSADPSATAVEWRLDGELLPWEGAQIEVQEGGIYSAVVFNQFCATQADPVEVGVIPAPDTAITLIGETVICEGESVYLLAGSSASTIGWYLDGQLLEWTGEQLEVQEGGAYFAILSNESCTVQTETVDIQVISYPDPTLSYENVLACQGDSIQLSANGALDSWQWFLDGITIETATGPEWWAAISGEYSYTGTLGPCTVSSEPVAISIVEPAVPVISFADDTLFSTPAVAYQWFLFGESIEGATGPFFVPLENGAYTVLTVDGNGCEAVSEPIEVELVNSAQARPLPQGWKVYPNPASDWLILELPGNVGGNFTLYDLTGRTKASGALFGGKTRIDTGGLKAGFYILDIRSGGKGGRAKVLLVPGN